MDAEQLREHLTYVPDFVQRWRALIVPGSCSQDVVSPADISYMESADREAATALNLLMYCYRKGTITVDRARMTALNRFWWIGGRCRGLTGHDDTEETVRALEELCWWVMRPQAGEIVSTEGVFPLIDACDRIRGQSMKHFPRETDKWLTEAQAQEYTGKGKRSLELWRKPDAEGRPAVEFKKDQWGVLYSKRGLKFRMDLVKSQQDERAEKARLLRMERIDAGHSNFSLA